MPHNSATPSPKNRVMVAYIATPGGMDALHLGIALAAGSNAHLDIVMALEPHATQPVRPGTYPHDRSFASLFEAQVATWVDDALAEVPDGISATAHVATGDSIPETLLAKGKELGSTALVVGTQGGGLFKRFTLGSVVNSLLHSSPIPLALAPAGFNHPGPIDRITVMYADTPAGKDVLALGTERANLRGIPLRIVSFSIDSDATAATVNKDAEVLTITAHSVSEAMQQLTWLPGELVVLGSSRLAPPGRLFLGTTATHILRHAPVPALAAPRGYRAHPQHHEER